METLEDDSRSWYEGFHVASLYSLKDFHVAFCDNYKQNYPSLLRIENFCGNFENLFQLIRIDIDDEDLIIDETEKDFFEFSLHQDERSEISYENS